MPENKTKATEASVARFLDSLPEPRRADAKALARLMESVSGQKPRMWGRAIVGFGSYHYRYDSGREGDMPLLCFSPRKTANVVYNMGSANKALLETLGQHALSGSCLHIRSLSQVDPRVLRVLVAKSFAKMRAQYGK